jgi:hypothetical protein
MTLPRFVTLLTATSLGVIALNSVFYVLPYTIKNYLGVAWWSLFAFILLSFGLYFLSKQAALSKNKTLFNGIIMASVFFKMFIAVIVLVIYKKVYQPQDKNFLIPFFLTYFLFMIFETYFMIKLAKIKTEE